MTLQFSSYEWWGTIDYQTALDLMTKRHNERVAGNIEDSYIYLEHPDVITCGRATENEHVESVNNEIPVLNVPRGGLATYHGPGQMIGYFVISLSNRDSSHGGADIHAYLRALENGLIAFIKSEFGLISGIRDGYTGVWIDSTSDNPGRKLASIGVSARKWVTSHGFGLNIKPDMKWFNSIVPCGITDATMTSIESELKRINRDIVWKSMKEYAGLIDFHIKESLQMYGWGKSCL